jgi:hypothetical protein
LIENRLRTARLSTPISFFCTVDELHCPPIYGCSSIGVHFYHQTKSKSLKIGGSTLNHAAGAGLAPNSAESGVSITAFLRRAVRYHDEDLHPEQQDENFDFFELIPSKVFSLTSCVKHMFASGRNLPHRRHSRLNINYVYSKQTS